jgi:hypothetical protein
MKIQKKDILIEKHIELYLATASNREKKFFIELNEALQNKDGLLTEGVWDYVSDFFSYAGRTGSRYLINMLTSMIFRKFGLEPNGLLAQIVRSTLAEMGVEELLNLIKGGNTKRCTMIGESVAKGTVKGLGKYGYRKIVNGLTKLLGAKGDTSLVSELMQNMVTEFLYGQYEQNKYYQTYKNAVVEFFCKTDFTSLISKIGDKASQSIK